MSTPSGEPNEEQYYPFVKPTEQQVGQWYEWVRGLINNEDSSDNLIWLAAVTATTEPAGKPSEIPNLQAIIAGSAGKIKYNDGKGNPVSNLPDILDRRIPYNSGNKIDKKDLYIPLSTELATSTKYPKVADRLGEVARGIIDHEEEKIDPPAFVRFRDAKGKQSNLNGPEVQNGFRVNSSNDIPFNVQSTKNVFMLPTGQGVAAFSDYAVILKGDALEPGPNTLEFGVKARHFRYTVKYTINVETTQKGEQK
jgi:hypothetical protein